MSGLRAMLNYLGVALSRVIPVHQKLDSVEIHSAMANSSTNSNPFCAFGRKEFNLNLRSQGQIRDSKQAHPDIAEIDAESIDLIRPGEYLHGGVQELTLPATSVMSKVTFEKHLVHE